MMDTKKVVSAFVGLVTALTMSGASMAMPLVAQADTVSDLQAQISAMLAQIATLQAQLSAAGGTTTTVGAYNFTMLLKQGVTNSQVKDLQKVLNMDPATQVATTGAGAPGSESSYFGAKTKAAVIKFQAKYSLTADGIVGAKTRAKLNSIGGTTGGGTTPVVTGTNLVVALASDTPAAGSIIAGQAIADLAHFTLTNKSSVDAKVTNLTLSRTGISNDATLANVYLYEGTKRLTDSAAVSQTKVTFNDLGGLFTIPAGGSKTIAVKADILAGTAGQVIGVSLDGITSNVTLTSALPIGGHMMSIASATMAGVTFATTVSPTGTPAVDPQDGYVMWQNSVSITTRAVDLKSFALRQIGSVSVGDLKNFKLYVDGTQVGATIASVDANGYVTFDLTSSPVRLQTGTRIIKVLGDIVGGSTRTFSFSLRQSGDAMMVDSELGQPVAAVASPSTTAFSARTTGTNTVNAGNLTITKKADSLTGNVVSDASNVSLGKFEFKASGESIKVENLRAYANVSTVGVGSLRNGAIFANGVQIGSTAALTDSTTGSSYTEYNLGSSLIVVPGTPTIVEIRADIYDGDGTPATFASGDTIQVGFAAGATNLQKLSSLNYTSNSAVVANQLTVATGALSMSKNQAFGNQATVSGKSAYKLGSFNLVGGSAENVNIDSIVVSFTGSSSTPATQLSDVYVVYGTKTSTTKSSVTLNDNTFSINEVLAANASLPIDVYGTLSTTLGNTDTIIASTTVSGTTAVSSKAVTTGSVVGQTITILNGTIGSSYVNETGFATKLLAGGTQQKVATFKFTATNDTFTVTDIATKFNDTNSTGAITAVVLKAYGTSNVLATTALNGLIASSTGLTVNVPANSETNVDVYLNLNSVGAGAATTTADVKVTLEGFKYNSSAGSQGEDPTDRAGNDMYVVKTIPTITNVALSDTILAAGTKTLSKFSIAADAAGPISWKKITFTIAKSGATTLGATSTMQLVDSSNNVIAGTFATSTDADVGGLNTFGTTAGGTMTFVADDEQLVSSSQTYSLKAVVGGTVTAGFYVSTNIAASAGAIAADTYDAIAGAAGTQTPAFVWSDKSSLSHTVSTPDWLNDYKVKNLSTDTQTLMGQG